MRLILLLITYVLIINSTYSQTPLKDKEIQNHIDIAFKNLDTNEVNIAIELAVKKNKNGFLAFAYNTKGHIYQKLIEQGKVTETIATHNCFMQSKYNFELSNKLYDKEYNKTYDLNYKYWLLFGSVFPTTNLADKIYKKRNDYKNARDILKHKLEQLNQFNLENVVDSLKKERNPDFAKGLLCTNLGKLYQQLNIYEQAYKNFKDSKDHYIKINAQTRLAWSYQNIGEIYFQKKKFDQAIKNFEESRSIKKIRWEEKGKGLRDYLNTLNYLATAYISLGDYSKSQEYIKRAYQLNIKTDTVLLKKRFIETRLAEFEWLYQQNKLTIEEINPSEIEHLITTIVFNEDDRRKYFEKLYSYYVALSSNEDTLRIFELYSKTNTGDKSHLAINEVQRIGDLNRKIEKQKNRITSAFFIASLLLLVIIILGLLYNRNIKKLQEQELEKERLAAKQEQNLLQQEAKRQEELKNQELEFTKDKNLMLLGIYHDIKTPVNKIIFEVRNVLDNLRNTKTLKNKLNTIKESAGYLDNLAKTILLSDQKDLFIRESKHNLFTIGNEAIRQINGQKSLLFEIKNEMPTNTTADFDDSHILRVFINLLTNAIKVVEQKIIIDSMFKGSIILRVDNVKQPKYIQVVDNGLSIKESSLNSNVQGTGVGLRYVRKVIELHKSQFNLREELDSYADRVKIAEFSLPNLSLNKKEINTTVNNKIIELTIQEKEKIRNDILLTKIQNIPFYKHTELMEIIEEALTNSNTDKEMEWIRELQKNVTYRRKANFIDLLNSIHN